MIVLCVDGTRLRRDPLYFTIYVHWLYFLVYYAFPFVVLVIFNVLIYKRVSVHTFFFCSCFYNYIAWVKRDYEEKNIQQVRKANRDLRRLSRHQRREIGLATMLLCVVIVFLVCNVLPLVANVYENVYKNPPAWLVQTANLLVTFNSGINFVIYVIFGRKFKRIFLKIFCPLSPETGLDCMGRPSRADSPDFQTNDDSIATNTSNIEMRHSVRRLHHHHHHHHHNRSSAHNGFSTRSSSIYYPCCNSPKANNNSQRANNTSISLNNGHNNARAALDDAALC